MCVHDVMHAVMISFNVCSYVAMTIRVRQLTTVWLYAYLPTYVHASEEVLQLIVGEIHI